MGKASSKTDTGQNRRLTTPLKSLVTTSEVICGSAKNDQPNKKKFIQLLLPIRRRKNGPKLKGEVKQKCI